MSIRNKLIIYTFSSIFITLIIVGVAIDRVFTNIYSQNATTELNHSYTNFQHELKVIEQDILNQILQIATDHFTIAITNIVNRYQNKNYYQPLIFNNDKKKIALYLLKQITLTQSDQAIIYDKRGDLIAYAIQNTNNHQAGFSEYKKGKILYTKQSINELEWQPAELPSSIAPTIPALNNKISFLTYSGKTNYIAQKNIFFIENSKIISRSLPNGKTSILGVVKVGKSLNDAFFKEVSNNSHTSISLLLYNGHLLNHLDNLLPIPHIDKNIQLHGSKSSLQKQALINKDYYIQSYVWPTSEGNNYLITSSSRLKLISALNETRIILIIAFSITAILAILLGIYWLNKLISTPLQALTEQATTDSLNQLPTFPVSKGNDEISLLGKVLNNMVEAIKNRETRLIENETQLNNTQKLAKIGGWKLDHNTGDIEFTDEIFNIIEVDKTQNPANTELVRNVIHPEDIKNVEDAFNESLAKHIPFDLTHRIITENGTIKTVHVYSVTLFKKENTPITTTGSMQDITALAIKDEQLRRSQKMDAIGKLTGGIAHDFNNMLGVILGFSELLQNTFKHDEKENRYINEIIMASNRASKLTKKLLSFSGKDSSSATNIDMNQFLLDEQIILEKILTVRIELKFELFNNLWQVSLNKDELEDAVINMCINSMHAMPSGGELVLATQNTRLNEIDIRKMDIPAGDYVSLSLTDNGTGMSQKTVEQIFEPFFTTKKDLGTGLGMSQVYGFIKRSKGSIHIHSKLEHGTRIVLYFPRVIEDKNEANDAIKTESITEADLTGTSTILVVDDELSLRQLTKEILTSNGYKVFIADSGKQALDILKSNHIDLMLSDVVMPDMNGYQLAATVNDLYPKIKIQMASGFSDIHDEDILNSEHHKNRLQKPFNSKTLLLRMKELC